MSNVTLFGCILLAALTLSRAAAPQAHDAMHIVPFRVASVYDGDTVTGLALLWPGLSQKTAVRLRGIDTPELKGGCEESKALAVVARTLADSLIKAAYQVSLSHPGPDKFSGRVVADVLVDGRNLSALLVERGVAKAYNGKGERPDWCGDKGDI